MKKSKTYWNNKWKKRSVLYAGRTLKNSNRPIQIDVRNFICANDDILKNIIENYHLKKRTYNETAHACQKFVVDFLTYIEDTKSSNCDEYWQFPFETIASKVGDCEDGAILMASLMINAGIPNWRVKVVGGLVKPQPTAPEGGHAYCIYLADRDDKQQEWEIHDWCYFEDTEIPTGKKPLARQGGYNQTYVGVWWSFNNEFCWSPEEVQIEGRVKN